jgi:hypothetical protein
MRPSGSVSHGGTGTMRNRPDLTRWREAAAVAIVIAAPLALIAATWGPLDAPPRPERGVVEREDGDGRSGQVATPDAGGVMGTPERRRRAQTPVP